MLKRKPIHWLSLTAVLVVATNLAFIGVARAQIFLLTGTDRFSQSTTVTTSPATLHGISTQATKEPGEPNHAGNTGGRSIWWRFQAPVDGTYTIDTNGSNFDTTLGVYRGSSVSQLSTTASNDDVDPGVIRYSSVDISGNAGDLFHIAVDGWNGDSGAVTLNISAPRPINDEFEYPNVTTQSPKILNGSNVNATKQSGEPNHGGNSGGKSVWWKLIVPASGTYTINTEGSNFDTTLGIYTGNSVDNLTLRAGNDDVNPSVIRHSEVMFFATAAETLNIAVDGWNGDSGAITLNISGPVNAGVSNPPSSFNLLFPGVPSPLPPYAGFVNDAPPLLFDWQDSIDPDGGPVTYNLILRAGPSLLGLPPVIVFLQTGITVSSFVIPILLDANGYRWSVEAVDADGEVTSRNTFFFSIGAPTGGFRVPRVITGLVFSDLNAARITAATISTSLREEEEIYVQKSETDGSFNLMIIFHYETIEAATPETEVIRLGVTAPGYETLTLVVLGGSELTIPVQARLVEFVDSDGDGLSDNQENNIYQTNPNVADSDSDGLSDGDEVIVYGTDPLSVDTDSDGISDGDEIAAGSNPKANPAAIIPTITILLSDD